MFSLEELILVSCLKWWCTPFFVVFSFFLKKSYSSSISEGQIFWLWYSWLAVFLFSTLNILYHSLIACKVSAEKSTYSLTDDFFVCDALLSLTTVSSLFNLTFDKWLKSSFVKTSLHSIYLYFFVFHRILDAHFSPQI